MDIRIRDATPEDAGTIADYNTRMAEETEGRTLDPEVIGPGVVALLSDPGKGRYWIADADGSAVGQLMVTCEWSDWRNGNLWWIQSVYVHPEQRCKGVFTALYRHVESLAEAESDVCGLRLYVESGNHRAQQTYAAMGMVEPGYLVMESILGRKDKEK